MMRGRLTLPLLLLSAASFAQSPKVDIAASVYFRVPRAAPLETVEVLVAAQNLSNVETAHDVRVVVRPAEGATIAGIALSPNSAAGSCAIEDNTAVCTVPLLKPLEVFAANVALTAPDRDSGGTFGLSVEATPAEGDGNPGNNTASSEAILARRFRVTRTDDSGPGTLRQAMLDANALCSSLPCRISFDLPDPLPESGRFTISPRSLLPALAAIVDLDGSSRVEINGRDLSTGDGFVIRPSCETIVRGVAIRDFPGTGVVADAGEPAVACHLLGFFSSRVQVTDSVIERNLRGIVSSAGGMAVRRNAIGANRRSAIFFQNVAGFAITDNRIYDNGASGIYVGEGSGDIIGNVISGNTDFGVARSLFAGNVAMHGNLIYGTGHTAIDVGLDLETPNVPVDVNFSLPNHPQLHAARYDAARNKTVITGALLSSETPAMQTVFYVEYYASNSLTLTGHAQAERYLGARYAVGSRDFDFEVDGDLTGQWIAATNTRSLYSPFEKGVVTPLTHSFFPASTSELSDPVRVRP